MRRHPALPLFLLLSLLLQCLLGHGALAANDRGLIFRAQRGDSTVYLLGSIHLGNPAMYPLRTSMEQAYANSDALVVELDINRVDAQALAGWMIEHGQYPAGESLRDHLQPQTWQRLQAWLDRHGLPVEAIARYRPGILVNMLTVMQMTQEGYSASLGLDQHFLQAAQRDGKPIIELEKAEDQLALLLAVPNGDALIADTLDELDDLHTASDTLFDAWKAGDGSALETEVNRSLYQDDAESREFFDKIFTQRNRAMTDHIVAAGHTHKRLFVVIGAGHLLGGEGVVELLRRRGFAVEQQ